VNNTQVSYGALENQLKKELTHDPNAFIMLRFDNTLTVQDMVDVLAIGNKLNSKMIIATAKTK
jgi:biopolymer transport protein ExbD